MKSNHNYIYLLSLLNAIALNKNKIDNYFLFINKIIFNMY